MKWKDLKIKELEKSLSEQKETELKVDKLAKQVMKKHEELKDLLMPILEEVPNSQQV